MPSTIYERYNVLTLRLKVAVNSGASICPTLTSAGQNYKLVPGICDVGTARKTCGVQILTVQSDSCRRDRKQKQAYHD